MAMARPAPKRPAQHRARRHLRLIPGGKTAASSKAGKAVRASSRSRLVFGITAAVTLAALVFGLVLLNIYLAQSSFRLAELEQQVAQQQALYRKMRLQAATAESPEKIAAAASGLGLVAPQEQGYLVGRERQLVAQAQSEPAQDRSMKAVLGARP